MRIEWKDTDDIEQAGQFIVYAENNIERAIIRRFVALNQSKQWKFWLHGHCYSCDLQGATSFNFGFVREKK